MTWNYKYEWMLERAYENIPKDLYETSERFEIPKVSVEYSGNRTYIVNFSKIAQVLSRDANHILRFFNKELATFGQFDGQRAIFVGKFSKNILQKKLEKYAKTYVICPQCGKPDTKLIKEGRILFIECMACGAKVSVPKI